MAHYHAVEVALELGLETRDHYDRRRRRERRMPPDRDGEGRIMTELNVVPITLVVSPPWLEPVPVSSLFPPTGKRTTAHLNLKWSMPRRRRWKRRAKEVTVAAGKLPI